MANRQSTILAANLPLFRAEIFHSQEGNRKMSDSSDFEWETALAQLDRLTDEALADLAKKVAQIQKKRASTPSVYAEAFQ